MIKKIILTVSVLCSCFSSAENLPKPQITIGYKSQDGCSFMYSPVYYCDKKHLDEYSVAIRHGRQNFFKDFVLVTILERPYYHQHSVAVVNKETGKVYPVPIDVYSGTPGKGNPDGQLEFSSSSNRLCIVGDVLVYRSIKSGRFCFYFEGERFSGYKTTYMN